MLKNTHLEVGLTFYLTTLLLYLVWFTSFVATGYFPIYAYLVLPILALLPDIDHPGSYLIKMFPPLKVIARIDGHRTWSHSILFMVVVSALIYLGLGTLFGYFDTSYYLFSGVGLDNWTDPLKFFFYSKEYLAILFGIFAHVFADSLTKGHVKYFYFSRVLREKFSSNAIWNILTLPLMPLLIVEDAINGLSWGIMPLTWSRGELEGYATLFNFLNIGLFGYIMYTLGIQNHLTGFTTYIQNTLQHLNHHYAIYIFIVITIIYFFGMSFGKAKEYARTLKDTVIFLFFASVVGFGFVYGHSYLASYFTDVKPIFVNIGLGLLYALIAYAIYIKVVGRRARIATFNIMLNEALYALFYLVILGGITYNLVHFNML